MHKIKWSKGLKAIGKCAPLHDNAWDSCVCSCQSSVWTLLSCYRTKFGLTVQTQLAGAKQFIKFFLWLPNRVWSEWGKKKDIWPQERWLQLEENIGTEWMVLLCKRHWQTNFYLNIQAVNSLCLRVSHKLSKSCVNSENCNWVFKFLRNLLCSYSGSLFIYCCKISFFPWQYFPPGELVKLNFRARSFIPRGVRPEVFKHVVYACI